MPLSRRSLIIGAALGATALTLGAHATGRFTASRDAARLRVARQSRVIDTPDGALEFAVAGFGPPMMMIHGTGGGYDQGLRFGQALIARGMQIVAPSRFGYLRSDFPQDPSPARQADALVRVLDTLGIDRLPVAGGSAGALPGAQFALRHPDRCSALVLLVPAMNLTGRDPVEFTALQEFLVGRLLTSDLWFWTMLRLAPDQVLATLLATDPALLPTVSAAERERATLIAEELMPISLRSRGMANDGHYSGHPAEIEPGDIRVPTLVVSAEDDRFGTADTARTLAAAIPGARLTVFPTGGHIWLGHDDDLAARITTFLEETGV
ncbi:MAG: alpha/beta fold hydrolase [Pseudooceanicola sp.]